MIPNIIPVSFHFPFSSPFDSPLLRGILGVKTIAHMVEEPGKEEVGVAFPRGPCRYMGYTWALK